MTQTPYELLLAYFEFPEKFWTEKKLIQAEKARIAWQRWLAVCGPQKTWLGDLLTRCSNNQQLETIYVSGLGGSGSHWLGGMLADCEGGIYCGEVYFPDKLVSYLASCPPDKSRTLVQAYQLIHGSPEAMALVPYARWVVNTAAGIHRADLYRQWEPRAKVIYLIRDPRDQVLSTTFRKANYRGRVFAEVSDEEYLAMRIRTNVRSFERAMQLQYPPTIKVKYEDLKQDTASILGHIMRGLNQSFNSEVIKQLVNGHSAERIREGSSTKAKGNLDEGGISQGWRRDANGEIVGQLHTYLQDPIFQLGYSIPGSWFSIEKVHDRSFALPSPPKGSYFIGLDKGQWSMISADAASLDAVGVRFPRQHKISPSDIAWANQHAVHVVSCAGNETFSRLNFSKLPSFDQLDVLDISGLSLPKSFLDWLDSCSINKLIGVGTDIKGKALDDARLLSTRH